MPKLCTKRNRFDSCPPAVSSPPTSIFKSSAHYDPILTSSFDSPFRFVRTPVRGGTVPIRRFVGGGGEKNRVPRCQPARGGKTACRVDRRRNRLFASKQERPRDFRRSGALR